MESRTKLGRREKHTIQVLSKRLVARTGGQLTSAEFTSAGMKWRYSEATKLRSGLRTLERMISSKFAQFTLVNRCLKTRALDELIANREISAVEIHGEKSEASPVIGIKTSTKNVFLNDPNCKTTKNKPIVATEFLMGQGLGNQLWSYAALRTAALRSSSDFAVFGEHNYKGMGVLEIDFGKLLDAPGFRSSSELSTIIERQTLNSGGQDVSRFDKRVAHPPGDCILMGNFQSFEYLRGCEDYVRGQIRPSFERFPLPPEVTVIHVRMGDFVGNSVFLGSEYYSKAIRWVHEHYPRNTFLIVSDQPERATKMLRLRPEKLHPRPKFPPPLFRTVLAPHHFGQNLTGDFNLMYSAKSLIIPASSLSWWAGFLSLKEKDFVLAPQRWAAHNASGNHWSTAEIATPGFSYVTSSGQVVESE